VLSPSSGLGYFSPEGGDIIIIIIIIVVVVVDVAALRTSYLTYRMHLVVML
jgi:hypothetical protein